MTKDQIARKAFELCPAIHLPEETSNPSSCICRDIAAFGQSIADEARAEWQQELKDARLMAEKHEDRALYHSRRAEKAESELAEARKRLGEAWGLLESWRPRGWIDNACEECIPGGDIVIHEFRCAYHEVKALVLAQQEAPKP